MGYFLRHFLHFFSSYILQKNSEERLRASFWQQTREGDYRGQQKAYSCTKNLNTSASIISVTVFFNMSYVITASPNTQSCWWSVTENYRMLRFFSPVFCFVLFFLGRNPFLSKSRSFVCENVYYFKNLKSRLQKRHFNWFFLSGKVFRK